MRTVGKTPNGLKFIRMASQTPKNIQEGSAEISCEDINILSHPRERYGQVYFYFSFVVALGLELKKTGPFYL